METGNTKSKVDQSTWSKDRLEWSNRLHALWTKAVGTEKYNKEEWQEFEEYLERGIVMKQGKISAALMENNQLEQLLLSNWMGGASPSKIDIQSLAKCIAKLLSETLGDGLVVELRKLVAEARVRANTVERSSAAFAWGWASGARMMAEKVDVLLAPEPSEPPIPFAYVCPANCGCMWRDNGDSTMSLFGKKSVSCKVCEPLPLKELIPVYKGESSLDGKQTQEEKSTLKCESAPQDAAQVREIKTSRKNSSQTKRNDAPFVTQPSTVVQNAKSCDASHVETEEGAGSATQQSSFPSSVQDELSEAEIAGIKQGLADVAAGRVTSLEQIQAELAAQPSEVGEPRNGQVFDADGIWCKLSRRQFKRYLMDAVIEPREVGEGLRECPQCDSLGTGATLEHAPNCLRALPLLREALREAGNAIGAPVPNYISPTHQVDEYQRRAKAASEIIAAALIEKGRQEVAPAPKLAPGDVVVCQFCGGNKKDTVCHVVHGPGPQAGRNR